MTVKEKISEKLESACTWMDKNPEATATLVFCACGVITFVGIFAQGCVEGRKRAIKELIKVPGVLDAISKTPNPGRILNL
ncbi:MAG: hypothetical protein [Chaetfec virus UA24_144]|nr:MAG: hypothetical protein [Chaetfec virus UA24_144]